MLMACLLPLSGGISRATAVTETVVDDARRTYCVPRLRDARHHMTGKQARGLGRRRADDGPDDTATTPTVRPAGTGIRPAGNDKWLAVSRTIAHVRARYAVGLHGRARSDRIVESATDTEDG